MFATTLLFALATISPSSAVRLADAPVIEGHGARLLEIDQRLEAMPDSWSIGAKVTAITAFSVAGVCIALAPVLAVSVGSFIGLFIGAGLAAFAGLGIIVGIVACIVGAVGLSHERDERAKLLEERAEFHTTPIVLAPVQGVVLASF